MIRENVIQKIKDMCKVVNQKMLLDSLNDTRICDQLLVSDPQQSQSEFFYYIIRDQCLYVLHVFKLIFRYSIGEEDDIHSNIGCSNDIFSPACFSCPVVWETKFILHPRLKVSHLKGAVSRGIQALCNVLNGLIVSNRKNLFVYKDNNKNVFYLRYLQKFKFRKSE